MLEINMSSKTFFLNSLKYIVVSGISKGLNYLILLYFAVGIYSEQYITILLLLSLEQLLGLFLPLNNSNIIYSEKVSQYKEITNKLISTSLIIMFVYVLFIYLFKNFTYEYFGVSNIFIFISILFNVFVNGYLVYLTNYYKLVEEHNKAFIVQALFFISFIIILTFALFFDNKIEAFFIGKAIGFLIIFLILKTLKLGFKKIYFLVLDKLEFKKMLNLFSISILGWVSGLGFINLAKIYASPEMLVRIGYILNLWNVFLLIGIGINSVYYPMVKKCIIENNFNKVIKTKKTTLFIYLGIVLVSYLFFLLIQKMNLLNNLTKVNIVFLEIPNAILLFMFSVFHYVIHPFYMVKDRFGTFNLLNIISYVLWICIVVLGTYFDYGNFIIFLVLLYFLKSILLYIYGEKNLMIND